MLFEMQKNGMFTYTVWDAKIFYESWKFTYVASKSRQH